LFSNVIQFNLKQSHLNQEELKEGDEENASQKVILIRIEDLNLHKYDTRNKNLIKMLQNQTSTGGDTMPLSHHIPDYIDEIDLEMLRRKQKLDL
jgi:hypothetical protein